MKKKVSWGAAIFIGLISFFIGAWTSPPINLNWVLFVLLLGIGYAIGRVTKKQ